MTDTSDFEACIDQQARAIRKFRPHVVVGKSQGPIILKLLQRGHWNGPSILCCAACVPGIDNFTLPAHVPFLIVNGSEDIAVPTSVGESLVSENKKLGESVKLIIVKDGHYLNCLLDDTFHPNLSELVSDVWQMRLEVEGFDPRTSVPRA
eukprot:TRINITY_DN2397_c0_g1_i5.p1 TRINITY_DN2397_c0_g1~~TRINITY_DN2397_c0_g1_i5.p1  ORF type:complete len:150 (-),score=19.59 TRINITY_DN2397_c0_g1_i5:91-540(-)